VRGEGDSDVTFTRRTPRTLPTARAETQVALVAASGVVSLLEDVVDLGQKLASASDQLNNVRMVFENRSGAALLRRASSCDETVIFDDPTT
jgi:hypothetical protein